MNLPRKTWNSYIKKLSAISQKSADLMAEFLRKNPNATRRQIIEYAYALSTRYGEAAAELACEMYDTIAVISGAAVAPADPADVATISEVAKAINGTAQSEPTMLNALSRLVKLAAADTTLYNARRDGAEWAWITSGDTCAFCFALSSKGWQSASQSEIKGNHAEHIHANCDCNYQIRFSEKDSVEGYDPDAMYKEYNSWSPGANAKTKINARRRQLREQNKDAINERKRELYAESKQE